MQETIRLEKCGSSSIDSPSFARDHRKRKADYAELENDGGRDKRRAHVGDTVAIETDTEAVNRLIDGEDELDVLSIMVEGDVSHIVRKRTKPY